VSPTEISFTLDGEYDGDASYFELLERLGPMTFLGIAGRVSSHLSGTRIEGALNGEFLVINTPNSYPNYYGDTVIGSCSSRVHHFVLERE